MAETLVRNALVLDAKLVRFAVGLANATDGYANCGAAALWTVALVTMAMLIWAVLIFLFYLNYYFEEMNFFRVVNISKRILLGLQISIHKKIKKCLKKNYFYGYFFTLRISDILLSI